MKLFENLFNLSTTPSALQDFIQHHLQKVYDFENSSYELIREEQSEIENFILFKGNILSKLDYSNTQSRAFIILLFELCERLSLSCTIRLENVIRENNLEFGSRLKASRLYLLNITNNSDLVDRFEEISQNLQIALDEEEDNNKKVLATFVNYVASVVLNTNSFYVVQLIEKIKEAVSTNKFSFLQSGFIKSALAIDVTDLTKAHFIIQSLIEKIFERNETSISKRNVEPFEILIEEDTEYSQEVIDIPKSFKAIRKLSVKKYGEVKADSIFYSLGRGVSILESESQLFAYMYSYGDMHYNKLLLAFQALPNELFKLETDIIDWACGQGMATLSFLDFIKENEYLFKVKSVTLIEPSEIALRRAALHTRIFSRELKLKTVNKDFDQLVVQNILNNTGKAKLHLFSNIVDVEQYSITHLLELIKQSFSGVNYFICVSPYIDDKKTGRIDSFVNFFSTLPEFRLIASANNKKGDWINGWSRVMRIFKVYI